jgi:hypothetical protein
MGVACHPSAIRTRNDRKPWIVDSGGSLVRGDFPTGIKSSFSVLAVRWVVFIRRTRIHKEWRFEDAAEAQSRKRMKAFTRSWPAKCRPR